LPFLFFLLPLLPLDLLILSLPVIRAVAGPVIIGFGLYDSDLPAAPLGACVNLFEAANGLPDAPADAC
jgi:hypothetical protein